MDAAVSSDNQFMESEENDPIPVVDTSSSYLTLPEELLSLTTVSELEDAVEHCKTMVVDMAEETEEKKALVRRLIELRLRLHMVREAANDDNRETNIQSENIVLGHHFISQNHPKSLTMHYCDRCSEIIWNAIHVWHLCKDCEYKCHSWCLKQVCRICAHVAVSETPDYEKRICPEPETGLAAQNYRCAECLTRTSPRKALLEPRRCDYDGKYYCPTCHWNSMAVIPARVINNWDFVERKVCRATKQRLQLLAGRPLLDLERLNTALFASVDELKTVKKLRQRILLMKKYLTTCRIATKENLTWQLKDRLYFLENDDRYSVKDLVDLRSGTLLLFLKNLIGIFEKHIVVDCEVCRGQGFHCELCEAKKAIFPFYAEVETCTSCGSAYHLSCWLENNKQCNKCLRKLKRQARDSGEEM